MSYQKRFGSFREAAVRDHCRSSRHVGASLVHSVHVHLARILANGAKNTSRPGSLDAWSISTLLTLALLAVSLQACAQSDGAVTSAPRAAVDYSEALVPGKTKAEATQNPIALNPSFAATPNLAAHPRLILDSTTLTTLRARVAANTTQWQSLKATCDSFIGGTVQYPTGTLYPDLPNLGQGYEGNTYLPALLNEAMCYQMLKTSNPSAAAPYGAKAVDILLKMSTPFTSSNNLGEDPCTDDGYVMRNYGVGFGLGYDWLYELLTTAQRAQIYTTANAWITSFELPGGCSYFEYVHPQSNYYAGYFHAKAVIALATYDENPSGPALWTDWITNQFALKVQPYYAAHLAGGGWPEGFANYGPTAILNMSLPVREVKTATGQDLVHASAPYSYPLDSANYAMHFTWPSLAYFDDRDTNHSNTTAQPPGTTPMSMFQEVLGEITYWNSNQVSVVNQYRFAVGGATANYDQGDPWMVFLEVTPSAPVTPINTLPLSYLATGMGAVAARSDWTTGASWMSFRAAPYTNNPAQGEQYFDEGSLALVRGNTPLLVNATGWAVHNPQGTAGENDVYSDNYGTFSPSNGALGNRRPYNIFYVRHMNGATLVEPFGQGAYTKETNGVRTQVSAYEDTTSHVFVQARFLSDMYRPFAAGLAATGWAREIVYLRPNRFVVYDRTAVGNAAYDQFMAWHFPATPIQSAAAAGTSRFDVTYNGQYAGAVTTILPTGAGISLADLYTDLNPAKFWEMRVRPATAGINQQWMTVFDLSPSSAQVALATPVGVVSGGVVGVQLAASDGNSVVVSSTGGANAPIAGSFSYRVNFVAAHHVIADLVPSAGYKVGLSTSGGVETVSVSLGGTTMTSAKGVLDFSINSAGAL
jgi:hypothetical protein